MICMCCSRVFSHGVFLLEVGFPPSPDPLTSSFILTCACCPSSTCRVNLYETDIRPISPIPELLGMVDKAEEYGSVRCRVLSGKGSKDNFPKVFQISLQTCSYISFLSLFSMELWACRGLDCPRLHLRAIFCLISLSSGLNFSRFGPLDSPRANGPGP